MLKRFGFLPLAVTGVALLIGGLSALAGAGGSGPSILAQDEECGTTTPTATPEQQIAKRPMRATRARTAMIRTARATANKAIASTRVTAAASAIAGMTTR